MPHLPFADCTIMSLISVETQVRLFVIWSVEFIYVITIARQTITCVGVGVVTNINLRISKINVALIFVKINCIICIAQDKLVIVGQREHEWLSVGIWYVHVAC